MDMNEQELTRAKILGVLVRDAREYAGQTQEGLAQALDVSTETVAAAEAGQYVFSLPEVEIVAIFCGVPLSHFWGTRVLEDAHSVDYAMLATLRQRVIGAQLQQLRRQQGMSAEELADAVGVDAETVSAYEAGEKPIPLFRLENVGRALDTSLDHFIDTSHGPLARHEQERKLARRLAEMPEEMRNFVAEPINGAYLETAMHLSEMDAQRLRDIAESLLEITF